MVARLPFLKYNYKTNNRWRQLKPRPNDSNISTQHCCIQHFACIWPPCGDVLRHVGCCWLQFKNCQIFHATFVDVAWCCSRLARFVQQRCAWACALVWFSTPNMPQHVETGWPDACDMLRPTILRSVAFKCFDRLAGACKSWANNVGICCIEISFALIYRLAGALTLARSPTWRQGSEGKQTTLQWVKWEFISVLLEL